MSEFTLPPTPEKRRLAAVVFTDVVGYSAHMQLDETGTIARVEADFNRMRAMCFQQGGEVLNSMGDGLLLCFPSAAQAVSFALNVQDEFWTRKAGLPAGESLEHRIGIHLGDVVFLDNGTVAGDGVNIAARLEGIAPYGGICVSQSVYEAVKRKVPMQATYIGPEKVKNIAEPVAVWHIRSLGMQEAAATAQRSSAGTVQGAAAVGLAEVGAPTPLNPKATVLGVTAKGKVFVWLSGRKGLIAAIAGVVAVLGATAVYWNYYQTAKVGVRVPVTSAADATAGPLSIVVLPFTNLTGDESQYYVADGLTASLTADLSRIRDAFIVNAATAFTYKGKPVTVQQVSKDLGVRFVLQGSVQGNGSRIRINAQLADALSNAQLWSESFDGDKSDLFALQDQVTTRIGNTIDREMVIAAARESEQRRSDPNVTDLILRARAVSLKPRSQEVLRQMEDLYRRALALDPNNANAMVGLAQSLVLQAVRFGSGSDVRHSKKEYDEAHELALKAKELDPANPGVYLPIALYAQAHGDNDGYRRASETRLSLEPKNPVAYNNLAIVFLDSAEPARAVELLNQAINLDPKHAHPELFANMGLAYLMLGEYDTAIEWHLKYVQLIPDAPVARFYLAITYAAKGDDAKARAEVAELRRIAPEFRISEFGKRNASGPPAYKEFWDKKLLPAARRAGVPE